MSIASDRTADSLANVVRSWARVWYDAWEAFWFVPSQPHTLALIRIFGGAMVLYTHLVWTLQLNDFLGPQPWINIHTSQLLNEGVDGTSFAWSHLWLSDSPAYVWTMHLVALAIFICLTLGLWTRITSVLACLLTLSYCHRLIGSLFGLDQVNTMLTLYLLVGRSGDVWSLDRWLHVRKHGPSPIVPSTATTVAIRLIQLHLCVIYLFGGIAKMRGDAWWDGAAMWLALASYEYQSMDLTWLIRWPWLLALLAHVTLFWETFYVALIWPRLTRPLALAIAVGVHGGIALAMGMKTFGLAMIIANLAFLYPSEAKVIGDWVAAPIRRFRPSYS
jgi:hypothetical protein